MKTTLHIRKKEKTLCGRKWVKVRASTSIEIYPINLFYASTLERWCKVCKQCYNSSVDNPNDLLK